MGYIAHHAIIVTSCMEDKLSLAHKEASKIFSNVSPICTAYINGYLTFMIPPDGSKEGWRDSLEGDMRREKFLEWVRNQMYPDGSNSLECVEVRYGGDEPHINVTRRPDQIQRGGF